MTWFFLTIAAVFLVAIENVFEKKTLVKASTIQFAAMLAFSNAIVALPFLFIADLSQLSPYILGMILLASLPSAGASLLVFKTIKHNELSEAAPILALLPLVATFLAFVFLGERMSSSQLMGLFFMAVAMISLELKNLQTGSGIFRAGRGKYIVYLLLCLLLGGMSAISDRIILHQFEINPLAYLIIIQIFIAVHYLLFFCAKPDLIKNLKEHTAQSWKIVLFISILTVTHRYLYVSAIQLAASLGLVIVVYKLSSLVDVFTGGQVFKEKGIMKKTIVSAVMLSGIILLVLT